MSDNPRRCHECGSPWVVCAVREGTIGAFCCGHCNGDHDRKVTR